MSLGKIRLIFFVLLLIYFAGGFALTQENSEIYPFFSWLMFRKIPSRAITDFDISIKGANGITYSKPVSFRQAQGLYNSGKDATRYREYIANLAQSVEIGNPNLIAESRKQLEENFLVPKVSYELVKITFNPISYWKDGRIDSMRTVALFTTD